MAKSPAILEHASKPPNEEQPEDEEDDYMTMAIPASPTSTSFQKPTASKPLHESSLQRLRRLKRESEARAYTPPKQELARREQLAQEAALSKSILHGPGAASSSDASAANGDAQPASKGASMMAKLGFKPGQKLGAAGNVNALAEPIGFEVKEGREGVGMEGERKRKFREEVEKQVEGEKKMKVDGEGYRERVAREREEKRSEGLWWGAMRVLEGMEQDEGEGRAGEGVPNGEEEGAGFEDRDVTGKTVRRKKSGKQRPRQVNLLYRPLVKDRTDKEQERRARYDLLQTLSRNPAYIDVDEDADDRLALGREEEDEGEDIDTDEALEQYVALEPKERLDKVIRHLRKRYWYCFWCKSRYDDEDMEECPGLEADDHE